MPAKKDLTNLRVGKLTVLYENGKKNGKILWHCLCDCGNEIDVVSSGLGGKRPTQSCGCLQKERTQAANQAKGLEGKRFGKLTVIKRNSDKTKWVCQCDCGNITEVNTNHLTQHHTQSCGCLQKEKTSTNCSLDLTNQKFGFLTCIEKDKERSYPRKIYWKCKCDCGNEVSVLTANLRNGNTQSCGCTSKSHGEIKICQLLNENNIPYKMEYIFSDCLNPKTNKNLRFDFFVNDEYIIEFDGKQHFIEMREYFADSLKDIQYRDQIKNDWCKKNNVPLIRIPYYHYDLLKIEDLIPDSSKFTINK